jgi:hypothetical protein
MASTVITPIGILCFANGIWEAKVPQDGGKPRHSATLLFDGSGTGSSAYQELRTAIQEAAADKFGAAKAADPQFMRSLRLPLRDASEKSYTGFDKGEIYIQPWSHARPGVVDIHNNEILAVEADVWSGQLARMTVRPFAYENSGNKGVALSLEHVQIIKKDMPRMDGRQAADKAFSKADIDQAQAAALGIDPNPTPPSSGNNPW